MHVFCMFSQQLIFGVTASTCIAKCIQQDLSMVDTKMLVIILSQVLYTLHSAGNVMSRVNNSKARIISYLLVPHAFAGWALLAEATKLIQSVKPVLKNFAKSFKKQ